MKRLHKARIADFSSAKTFSCCSIMTGDAVRLHIRRIDMGSDLITKRRCCCKRLVLESLQKWPSRNGSQKSIFDIHLACKQAHKKNRAARAGGPVSEPATITVFFHFCPGNRRNLESQIGNLTVALTSF